MNFMSFNNTKQDSGYKLLDTRYSFLSDGRRIGILLRAPECKIVLKNISSKVDLMFSLHFVFYGVFHYLDKRDITIFANGAKVAVLTIDHDHKNSYLSFNVPAKLLNKENLELTLCTKVIHGDKDPVCAGISWKIKQEDHVYNSIPVAIQGFTNSGSSTVWDLLSECDNMDVERSAELRFLGRFHNLHLELQSQDKTWNDGCLKHFINQMYYFYNRVDVHGYEISIIHNDEFLRQMNAFFADMIGATKELSKQLKDASFRFPTEYEDKWSKYSFVKEINGQKQIFYQVTDYVRKNFLEIAYKYLDVFLHSFRGKKYRVFFNLAVRTDYDEAITMCKGTKFICIYRDPRNQYIQARASLLKQNLPINADFETPEKFVQYYQTQIVPWINSNSENVLSIRFEDFVLHYDKYKELIFKFLGEHNSNHVWPKMYFKPKDSMRNLSWYKDYQDNADVIYIQNHLKKYCLPEPEYSVLDLWFWKIRKALTLKAFQKQCCAEKIRDISEQMSRSKAQLRKENLERYKCFVFQNQSPEPEKILEAYKKALMHYVLEDKSFHKHLLCFLSGCLVGVFLLVEKDILLFIWPWFILASLLIVSALCLEHINNVDYWKKHVRMLEMAQGINFENISNTKIRHFTNDSLLIYRLIVWGSRVVCVGSILFLLCLIFGL